MGSDIWDSILDEDTISSDQIRSYARVPTPSPSVNWAIGGGIKPGCLYCFDGPESSGKSFFALECVKELLKQDTEGRVIWYDVEHAFSEHWRDVLIAPDDHKRIILHKETDAEKIFDHFDKKVMDVVEKKGGRVLGCVLDSVQSIIAPKERDLGSIGDNLVGGALSHIMPRMLRRFLQPSRRHQIPWIMISQVRVDMDPNAKYKGRTLVPTGGRAFFHHMDMELYFEKIFAKDSKIFGDIKNMNNSAEQVGHAVRVKVMKSRISKPHRVAEFRMHYDKGVINTEEEILKLGINTGVISRKGSNYYFDEILLGAGKEKAAEMLNSSDELTQKVLQCVDGAVSGAPADPEDVMLAEFDDETL